MSFASALGDLRIAAHNAILKRLASANNVIELFPHDDEEDYREMDYPLFDRVTKHGFYDAYAIQKISQVGDGSIEVVGFPTGDAEDKWETTLEELSTPELCVLADHLEVWWEDG